MEQNKLKKGRKMTKKRRQFHREIDKAKDEALETAKNVVEKAIPLVTDGFARIVTGVVKTLEESLRTDIVRKIEKRKSRSRNRTKTKATETGGETNVNPQ